MIRPGLRTQFMQHVGLRWGLVRRGMTLGVRALVQDDEGRILLVRHTYVPGWYFPGGGVEPGESAMASLLRELREEAAVVPAEPPKLFGLYRNAGGAGRDHVALYVVGAFSRAETGLHDAEIAEAGFFARDALPPETTRATIDRLAEVFDGAPVSETW